MRFVRNRERENARLRPELVVFTLGAILPFMYVPPGSGRRGGAPLRRHVHRVPPACCTRHHTAFPRISRYLSLAEQFGVSVKAMAIRLEELNLIER